MRWCHMFYVVGKQSQKSIYIPNIRLYGGPALITKTTDLSLGPTPQWLQPQQTVFLTVITQKKRFPCYVESDAIRIQNKRSRKLCIVRKRWKFPSD